MTSCGADGPDLEPLSSLRFVTFVRSDGHVTLAFAEPASRSCRRSFMVLSRTTTGPDSLLCDNKSGKNQSRVPLVHRAAPRVRDKKREREKKRRLYLSLQSTGGGRDSTGNDQQPSNSSCRTSETVRWCCHGYEGRGADLNRRSVRPDWEQSRDSRHWR